jgi:hypothetical protein
MQLLFEHPTLTEGKDVVQEKEATQEKDMAEVVTDPDLTRATEIKTPAPIVIPNQKGKDRSQKGKQVSRPHTSGD